MMRLMMRLRLSVILIAACGLWAPAAFAQSGGAGGGAAGGGAAGGSAAGGGGAASSAAPSAAPSPSRGGAAGPQGPVGSTASQPGSVFTATPPGSVMPSARPVNPSTGQATQSAPSANASDSNRTDCVAGSDLGSSRNGGVTGRSTVPGTGTPRIMSSEPGVEEFASSGSAASSGSGPGATESTGSAIGSRPRC